MCMYGSLVVVLFRCLLILHLQREIALFVSINLDRLSGLLLRLSRLDNVIHIIVLSKAAGFRMRHGQDSLGSFILTTQWNIWMIMQDVNKFLCNISFERLHSFKLFNRNLPFLIDRILCFLCLLGTATVLFTYAKAAKQERRYIRDSSLSTQNLSMPTDSNFALYMSLHSCGFLSHIFCNRF